MPSKESLYYIDIWDCLGPGIGADKGHVLQGHNPCTSDNLSGGRFKGTLQRLGSHPNGEWFTPLSFPWTSLWGIICASLHSVHCLYFFLNLKVSCQFVLAKLGRFRGMIYCDSNCCWFFLSWGCRDLPSNEVKCTTDNLSGYYLASPLNTWTSYLHDVGDVLINWPQSCWKTCGVAVKAFKEILEHVQICFMFHMRCFVMTFWGHFEWQADWLA